MRRKDEKNICPRCMRPYSGSVCPRCGAEPEELCIPFCLEPGSTLGDRVIIGCAWNADEEGIDYIGYDQCKKKRLYVRELFLRDAMARNGDGSIRWRDEAFAAQLPGYTQQLEWSYRAVLRCNNTVYGIKPCRCLPWQKPAAQVSCFEGASASTAGARVEQQDAARYYVGKDWAFAVLCDGMGGLRCGGAASSWCLEWMVGALEELFLSEESGISALLERRVREASRQVAALIGPDGVPLCCGTTVVCLYCRQDRFYYASVGDSRLYLVRGRSILQLTEDHDLFTRLLRHVSAGELTYEAALSHPQGNALTSYIGMDGDLALDSNAAPCFMEQQDVLLLCSDGVYRTLAEEELCTACGTAGMKSAAAGIMRRIAEKALPGQDNATCVLLRYHMR